jgi:CubicO group peptidase (beta-lactamase class C family)
MTTRRKGLTRRAGLAGLGGLAVTVGPAARGQPAKPPAPFEKVPVRGQAGPGLEPFDLAVLRVMDRHGIPGGAFAVAKDGRLVLAKGYGWSDLTTGAPVEPTTRFGNRGSIPGRAWLPHSPGTRSRSACDP